MKFKQILAAGTAAAILFSASACSKEEIQDKIWEKLNEEVFAPYTTAPETEKPAAATTTAVVYDEPSASDFTYYEEDGGIVITEYKGSARNLAIPAEIDGLPVTTIGEGSYNPVSTTLRGVMIPETVTTLRAGAFYGCEKLIHVVIPESVTSFGESLSYRVFGVFEDTVWLRKKQKEDPLVIVNHVVIDGKACTGDVAVPEGVTQIAAGAFQKCEGITGITLPNTLEKIGMSAFGGAFADSSCERVVIPDGVTEIPDFCFAYSSLKTVVLPDSVTEIGPRAFLDCETLSEIVIPDSVTRIANSVFIRCRELEKITLPDGLKFLGEDAFMDSGCEVTYRGKIYPPERYGELYAAIEANR